MRLNNKQEELIEQLVKEIETKFPDVKFVGVSPHPESENSLWLDFTKPDDEERMLDIIEYTGVRSMDILEEYGYHFLVMPVVENGELAAAS
ncbi:MAG: hypothetical protein ACE5I1_28705 [bacterium]